jgi:hypothetical protein
VTPTSLAALVARLRRQSGHYVLTSVRHGAHDAALQRTLQALHALGVRESPRPARSALDDTGLGLIQLGSAGPAAPALLLVGTARAATFPLIPAVQKVRAAADRTPLRGRYTLFTGAGDGHPDWVEIDFMSGPH